MITRYYFCNGRISDLLLSILDARGVRGQGLKFARFWNSLFYPALCTRRYYQLVVCAAGKVEILMNEFFLLCWRTPIDCPFKWKVLISAAPGPSLLLLKQFAIKGALSRCICSKRYKCTKWSLNLWHKNLTNSVNDKKQFLEEMPYCNNIFAKFQRFPSQTWNIEKLTACYFFKNPYCNPFSSSPSLVIRPYFLMGSSHLSSTILQNQKKVGLRVLCLGNTGS